MLLSAGTRLGPASSACSRPPGTGPRSPAGAPRVAVISTGNELSEPGQPAGRRARSGSPTAYMLAAAARQAGGRGHQAPRRTTTQTTVLAALEEQLGRRDLLVTTGGVSMGGEHDVVKAALSGSVRHRS